MGAFRDVAARFPEGVGGFWCVGSDCQRIVVDRPLSGADVSRPAHRRCVVAEWAERLAFPTMSARALDKG
jgi:hypothetical protein